MIAAAQDASNDEPNEEGVETEDVVTGDFAGGQEVYEVDSYTALGGDDGDEGTRSVPKLSRPPVCDQPKFVDQTHTRT